MYKTKSIKAAPASKTTKKFKLYLGIILDVIGMTPTGFPPLALIWAPISGLILKLMYRGQIGTVAGIFDFAEELIPGVNFIPTFTITWFYVYEIQGRGK